MTEEKIDSYTVLEFQLAEKKAASLGLKIETDICFFTVKKKDSGESCHEEGLISLEEMKGWLLGYEARAKEE